MKEFDKWMKKSDLSNYWNYDEEDAAKVGWEAALEWVLDRPKFVSWSKQDIEEYKEFCNKRRFLKRIEEELEDES